MYKIMKTLCFHCFLYKSLKINIFIIINKKIKIKKFFGTCGKLLIFFLFFFFAQGPHFPFVVSTNLSIILGVNIVIHPSSLLDFLLRRLIHRRM